MSEGITLDDTPDAAPVPGQYPAPLSLDNTPDAPRPNPIHSLYSQAVSVAPDHAIDVEKIAREHPDLDPRYIDFNIADVKKSAFSASIPAKAALDDIIKNYSKTSAFISNPRNMVRVTDKLGSLIQPAKIIKAADNFISREAAIAYKGQLEVARQNLIWDMGQSPDVPDKTLLPSFSEMTDAISPATHVAYSAGATALSKKARLAELDKAIADADKTITPNPLKEKGPFGVFKAMTSAKDAVEIPGLLADEMAHFSGMLSNLYAQSQAAGAVGGIAGLAAAPFLGPAAVPVGYAGGRAVGAIAATARYFQRAGYVAEYDKLSMESPQMSEEEKRNAATFAGIGNGVVSIVLGPVIPSGSLPTVVQALSKNANVRSAVKEIVRGTAHGMAFMGGAAAVDRIVAEAAKLQYAAPSNQRVGIADAFAEVLDASLTGTFAFLPMIAFGAYGKYNKGRKFLERTDRDVSVTVSLVHELDKEAKVSEIRKKDEVLYKEHIANESAGSTIENAYISKEPFDKQAAAAGRSPKVMAEELGVLDSYNDSEKTSQPIKMPLALFQSEKMDPFRIPLANDIKFQENGWTYNERGAEGKRIQQELRDEGSQIQKDIVEKSKVLIESSPESKAGYEEVRANEIAKLSADPNLAITKFTGVEGQDVPVDQAQWKQMIEDIADIQARKFVIEAERQGKTVQEVYAQGPEYVAAESLSSALGAHPKQSLSQESTRISIGLKVADGTDLAGKGEIDPVVAEKKVRAIADATGVVIRDLKVLGGSYQGVFEGALQLHILGSPEAIADFNAMVGYHFRQTEVLSHRPLTSGSARGYTIIEETGNVLGKPAEAGKFMARVTELVKQAQPEGKTWSITDGYAMLALDGKAALRLLHGSWNNDRGAVDWKGNWDEKQRQAFEKAIEQASAEFGIDITGTLDNYEAISENNDWSKQPNGEGYRKSLLDRGRDKLASRLGLDDNFRILPNDLRPPAGEVGPEKLFQASPPQTETPAFKKFFGDSKVVDEQGKPLVVYHSTSVADPFQTFKRRLGDVGIHFGTQGQAQARQDYIRGRSTNARGTAERVYPVYLSIQNPLSLSDIGSWDYQNLRHALVAEHPDIFKTDEIVEALRYHTGNENAKLAAIRDLIESKGYDGIVYNNTGEVEGSIALREAADLLRKKAYEINNWPASKNSFSVEEQSNRAYQKWHEAEDAERHFRETNGEDSYIAFRPTQIKSAIGNKGTFDKTDPNILHQAINAAFIPSKRLIELYKSKNPTSLLHEISHDWMGEMVKHVNSGQASNETLGDWRVVSDFLGVKPGVVKLTDEQHEKFARAWEQYWREGRSPSTALGQIFQRMKDWMMKVYGDSKQTPDFELTDEMRGFFDRQLASAKEIAAAKEEVGLKDAEVPDIPRSGLSELRERAKRLAEDELMRPMLEDIKAQSKVKLAAERERLTKEITNQVNQEPVFKAIALLGEGKKKSDYWKEASDYRNGKLDDAGMEKFEIVAEMSGYPNGEAMARDILLTDPTEARNAEVKKRVDAAMAPQIPTKEQLREQALAAVHNDAQTELIILEGKMLEDIISKKAESAERTTRRREESSILAAAVKEEARRTLMSRKLSEATAFRAYYTAERNAAVKAERARIKGDLEAFSKAKAEQMHSHAMATEAIRIKNASRRWLEKLYDFSRMDAHDFKNEEHFFQAANLLRRFGVDNQNYDPSRKQETLASWVVRMSEIYSGVSIPAWLLDESVSMPIKDMTSGQLKDFRDAVVNIKKVASAQNTTLVMMGKVDLDILAKDLVSTQKAEAGFGKGHKTTRYKSFAQKYIIDKKDAMVGSMIDLELQLKKLDGWRDEGPWQSAVFEPYRLAADKESEMLHHAAEKYREIWTAYSGKERKEMQRPIDTPEIGVGETLTKQEILTIAQNWGNPMNKQRMLEGRGWEEAKVKGLLDRTLDARDWKTVQDTWDFIDSYWPNIAEFYKEMTGVTPDKVEAESFITPYGPVKGGYFPLRADPRGAVRPAEISQENPLEDSNTAWRRSTKNGFIEERSRGAKYQVDLAPDGVQRHITDVIHDLTMRKYVVDLNRLLGREDIRASIADALGERGLRTFNTWADDITGKPQGQLHFLDHAFNVLRHRAVVVSLGMRLSTTMVQLDDVFSYGSVDPTRFGQADAIGAVASHLAKASGKSAIGDFQEHRRMVDFVYSKSKYMKYERGESPDRDLKDAMNKLWLGGQHEFEIGGEKFTAPEMSKVAMYALITTDRFISVPVWEAAYWKGVKLFADETKAVQFADKIVRRAQATSRIGDRPEILRTTGVKAAFTMFQSFALKRLNAWYELYNRIEHQGMTKENQLRLRGQVVGLWLVSTMLSSLIHAGLPTTPEKRRKYLRDLVGYGPGLVPYLRDVMDPVLNRAFGLKSFGYSPTPALKPFFDIARFSTKTPFESAAKLATFPLKIPQAFNDLIFNAADTMSGDMRPQVSDIFRRRPLKYRNRRGSP